MRAVCSQAQSYVQGLPAQKKKAFSEVFPSMDKNGNMVHFNYSQPLIIQMIFN